MFILLERRQNRKEKQQFPFGGAENVSPRIWNQSLYCGCDETCLEKVMLYLPSSPGPSYSPGRGRAFSFPHCNNFIAKDRRETIYVGTAHLHKAWIIFLVSWLEVGGSCAFMTKVTTLPESPETCPSTPSAWFTNLYWVGLRTDMGLGIGLWIHQNLQSGARPNKWLITAMC